MAITTPDDNFVSCDGLDRTNTHSAQVHVEDQLLRLYVEAAEFAGGRARDEIVFGVLRESHADVVSDVRARVDYLRQELSRGWHQLPQGHLSGATDGKLVVGSLAEFDVLDHATPGDAAWSLCKDGGDEGHLGDDVPVSHVPNEHLTIEGISSGHHETVIMGKGKMSHLMVVLLQPVNGLLLSKVPYDYI